MSNQKKAGEDENIVSSRPGIQGKQYKEWIERLRLHVRGQRLPVGLIRIPKRQAPFASKYWWWTNAASGSSSQPEAPMSLPLEKDGPRLPPYQVVDWG